MPWRPSTRTLWLPMLVLLVFEKTTHATNWAQTSGAQRQNVLKSPETEWRPRRGLGVAAIDPVVEEPEGGFDSDTDADEVSSPTNLLYILGGDDYDENDGTGGYHNDVWRSVGQQYIDTVDRVTNEPRVVSKMNWQLIWGDKLPPSGTTYDQWLECLSRKWRGIPVCRESEDPYNGDLRRWAPRRNHGALSFQPTQAENALAQNFQGIWVLGGRARSIDDIYVRESWGGVFPFDEHYTEAQMHKMFYRPLQGYDSVPTGDVPDEGEDSTLTGARYIDDAWREKTVLMNDIWASEDGVIWELLNPGCKYHEQGSPWAQGAPGTESSYCTSSFDCYGDSSCVLKGTQQLIDVDESGECRCNIWSPRERHAVVVYKEQLFVSGGLTKIEYQRCGNYPCGGGYRYWADDMWTSYDGETWRELLPITISKTLIPEMIPANWTRFSPRGEHSLVVLQDQLCVFGGRGRRHGKEYRIGEDEYLNDMWLSSDGKNWTIVQEYSPWFPRSSFVSGVRSDGVNEYLYIAGGQSTNGYTDEVWTLTTVNSDFVVADDSATTAPTTVLDASLNTTAPPEIEIPFGTDPRMTWQRDYDVSHNGSTVAHAFEYVSPDSDISMLYNLETWQLEVLRNYGVLTIRALASMESETTIKVRDVGNFRSVCDFKKRAEAVVMKCSVKPVLYDGYYQDARHVNLRGGMSNPYAVEEEVDTTTTSASSDEVFTFGADGCTQATDPDEQISELDNIIPLQEDADRGWIPEHFCRWNPVNRTHATGLVFRNKFYLFGGFGLNYKGGGREEDEPFAGPLSDSWFRDDSAPIGRMAVKPEHRSSDTMFEFRCDEAKCIYEVQILRYACQETEDRCLTTTVYMPWTIVTSEFDVLEILVSGRYTIQLHTYDLAGNVAPKLFEGLNQHTWIYVSALPVGLIVGLLMLFGAFGLGAYWEARRRRKKRAMERYALKRMRRKFKGMAKDTNKKDQKMRRKKKKKKKKGNKVAPLSAKTK